MFGLTQKDINTIISVLFTYKEIDRAIIFGSRAKGNYKNGSDVDIALIGEKVSFEIVSNVSSILNEETNMPYKFDIIDYNSITNLDFKEHIDRVGMIIFQQK